MSQRNRVPYAPLGVGLAVAILLAGAAQQNRHRETVSSGQHVAVEPSRDRPSMAGANQPEPASETQHAEQKETKAKNTKPPSLRPDDEQPAAPYQADCSKPNESDLCAQQAMVRATESQADYTWYGLVLVFPTLLFTAVAALAAAFQVWLSRQSLILTERAFVFIKEFNTYTFPDRPIIRIMPKWENTGKTPTENMINHVNWHYFEAEMPDGFGFPDLGDDETVPVLISPGGEVFSSNLDIGSNLIDAAKNGRGHIYIWGWAEYSDVFQGTIRHRTEFCNEVEVTPIDGQPNQIRLQFKMYKKHNGADAQCPPERWRTMKGGAPNPRFKRTPVPT